jgi:hypothetical protein
MFIPVFGKTLKVVGKSFTNCGVFTLIEIYLHSFLQLMKRAAKQEFE